MAELLVRVVDKVNPDSLYKDVQCTKRGDVIVVCPDGWMWGKEEIANPDWRIVRVPDLSVSEAEALLAPEPETAPGAPSRTLQRRAFKLAFEGDPPETTTAEWVHAVTTRKPPIEDPMVLGSPSTVIG